MIHLQYLTKQQVRDIRAQHQPGVRGAGYESLAHQYGVGVSTVRDILTYRTAYAMETCHGTP